MQRFFADLRPVISSERLEAFREQNTDSDLDLFARYIWNMSLCEALYPTLHMLEVALRNSLHNAASQHFGSPLWFDLVPSVLKVNDREVVTRAATELTSRKKPHEPGRIVAELSFGFWTSLLRHDYEQVLWPFLLQPTFSNMPASIRQRGTVAGRLNTIRHLRNRVFHYEPIWRRPNLDLRHAEVLEAIDWINPALKSVVVIVDRFPSVYQQGIALYHGQLADFLRDSGYQI